MKLSFMVEHLRGDLLRLGALGDETTAAAAERVALALEGALSIRLLGFLGEAAMELSAQLPEGQVEVRLAGSDPELVYVPETEAGEVDADLSARLTLRLPESVKGRVEAAARREGVSTNTWVVRALSRTGGEPRFRSGSSLSGRGRS
ncbi:MAG TPA: toxin-antitoxin system HicB family antitoxin [Candidatus Dormibacteraeota bacterium]|nr:toxin-antitoxin system HicB family antitoxin [Candidatus Dormibacteraeota bacterium]